MSHQVRGGPLRSTIHPPGQPVDGGRDPGESLKKREQREARAPSSEHGPAKSQRTAQSAPPSAVSRSPKTVERLGRLRRELARISPAPGSPEEAVAEIAMALDRANLGDWAVPLYAAENREPCAEDNSLKIRLAAHEIVIQSNGAFRIVDQHPPMAIYFSMPGRSKLGQGITR